MIARIRTVELQPEQDGVSRPSSAKLVQHVRPQMLQCHAIRFAGAETVVMAPLLVFRLVALGEEQANNTFGLF